MYMHMVEAAACGAWYVGLTWTRGSGQL